ncbi:baseplate J/gp47 family protein [Draconibacterium sp. IB214405]|uniref:baseplate J/gp47 family protein n=1 Tax=Draconibacterium sp. IB214405 TaxID=3097352 RepID=UPI002A0EA091|nr:baseplate J/gp47 family protein [Draconibacterium sp. IB214405]MDX8339932.1 baseplate J/gp47 family protein [Draconibacterium sp. IB214405]
MAKCGKDILLSREGTEQEGRLIAALNPDALKLNDFGVEQWMDFAYTFASHVNYFDVNDSSTPNGNWQDFFKAKPELEDFISGLEKESAVTPHLALFITFVKLLEYTKQRFNKLTKRHLDFYFKQILQIEKQAPTPDKVHVIFELAKNAVAEKIATETALDGGKDADGKKLIYKTSGELVANQTKVASLKSVYNDHDNSKLKAAAVANSFDGIGEEFPDKEIKWWPFGYYEVEGKPDTREYPELPDAKIGFAVAGEILELQEGERTVQLCLSFSKALPKSISFNDLKENIAIYCTGEKDWLGPFDIISTKKYLSGTESNRKYLNISFRISKEEEAVVNYLQKVHGESFNTASPVCRILIKTENKKGHQIYRNLLTQSLQKIEIKVAVQGIRSLSLQNDLGVLNAEKPFYPFSNSPVEKSKFHIDYAELFKKNWNNLKVHIKWKNAPDNFKTWYEAYQHSFRFELSHLILATYQWTKKDKNVIVTGDGYFTSEIEINDQNDWEPLDTPQNIQLFNRGTDECYAEFTVPNTNDSSGLGPIRLSLNQDFLHDMFPRLYSLSITNENALIPNEPYTPFVEQISLDYNASGTFEPGGNKSRKDFQLFHEHPFGQSEECLLLNAEDSELFVVPEYCKGGNLFIGLENAVPQQTVSLLIQVLEGSENPEAESFVGKQHVGWDVLCNNNWMSLDSTTIISNNTENLLKSGILKFSLPKEANTDNTLLPPGLTWLRARIHKKYNAVSKAIGIHAQVIQAQLGNSDNDLQHLMNGLPAETISKMVNRIPKVKGLAQPYNSFGGKAEESDEAYYRRISERLRHKNRAITIWDYENLVLQNFPEIHKAKCLSHSCTKIVDTKRQTKYLAPGSVVVVVIPDIVNKNVFDIYKPRVSKATLEKIQQYLSKLNSKLIQTLVINPEYEELRVDLKVKFHKGYDEIYYKKVLQDDLTRLLSPWAFDRTAPIRFGLSLHKSVLINYTEQLDYVDFITDVRLFQKNAANGIESEVTIATPSSPEAILVSSKEHSIRDAVKNCIETAIEPAETCQK